MKHGFKFPEIKAGVVYDSKPPSPCTPEQMLNKHYAEITMRQQDRVIEKRLKRKTQR